MHTITHPVTHCTATLSQQAALAAGKGRKDAWEALLGLLSAAEEELTACADSCCGADADASAMEEDGDDAGAFSPAAWRGGVGGYARGLLVAVRSWLAAAEAGKAAEAAERRGGGRAAAVVKKRKG